MKNAELEEFDPLSKEEMICRLLIQNEKLITEMEERSIALLNLSFDVTGVINPGQRRGRGFMKVVHRKYSP